MAKMPQLKVEKRDLFGRKVKTLRQQGIIPANVYGKKTKSVSIQVDQAEFNKLFEQVGETSLLELSIDGESKNRPVLITNVQTDPVSSDLVHVDFHQVLLTEKVTATIPVEIIGESLAVKEKGGVLVVALNEIEIEALPTDLPEHFQVSIAKLEEIGDSILLKDLKIDLKILTVSLDESATVVTVQPPQKEEEPEAPLEEVEAEAEGEEAQVKADDSKEAKPDTKEAEESASKPKDQSDAKKASAK